MDLMEAIKARHSVRAYTDKKIEGEVLEQLNEVIEECNKASGLNIQLVLDEPTAFASGTASYGKFEGVNNYIVFVGAKAIDLDEKVGYYGEKIAIRAQQLGLNTCWVALTFSKGKAKKHIKIGNGEKLAMAMPIGYGKTNGVPSRSKPIEKLCVVNGDMPDWFRAGMEAAQLAPTAINQQKFKFVLEGDKVKVTTPMGINTKVDMGIAKYHFEVGSGRKL